MRWVLVISWVFGCGASPTETAPLANVATDKVALRPEIVEQAWPEFDPPADMECAAEPPSTGILDRTSPLFAKITVKRGKMVIEEHATFRDRQKLLEVTARTGGCAHVGMSFDLQIVDSHPATELDYHLKQGVALMQRLPVLKGLERDFRAEIAEDLAKRKDDSCNYYDGEMNTTGCSVEQQGPTQVLVSLGYDIAL